jgi:hypothetical protein
MRQIRDVKRFNGGHLGCMQMRDLSNYKQMLFYWVNTVKKTHTCILIQFKIQLRKFARRCQGGINRILAIYVLSDLNQPKHNENSPLPG